VKVAIYTGADRGGGAPGNELAQLRAWCAAVGHTMVAEYIEAIDRKGSRQRPQFAAMLDAAHHRQFDMVLVWTLGRINSEGMAATAECLYQLAATGVAFHSRSEPALSTDNDKTRDTVLAAIVSLAKLEDERKRARGEAQSARGTRIGRSALTDAVRAQIAALAADNPAMSNYAIAKKLKLAPRTVRKYRPASSSCPT
jgi:DNA invertase Pin-like site-specific DNA recombinase